MQCPYALGVGTGGRQITLDLRSVQEIWAGSVRQPDGVFDDHSAFTDILRYEGDLFVTFRESTAHVPGTNGRVAVLRSQDNGSSWARVADLRIDTGPGGPGVDPGMTCGTRN